MKLFKLIFIAAITGSGTAFAEEVDVVSRHKWGAAPAISVRETPIKNVPTGKNRVTAENRMPLRGSAKYLTVHHTAKSASKKPISENMLSFQKTMFAYNIEYASGIRKDIFLGDIPYHFLIDSKGVIAEGRELKYSAYSNTNYLTPIDEHITVVLDGNFDLSQPSDAQVASLIKLLDDLSRSHNISIDNIGIHKDVAHTSCPGEHLEKLMPNIITSVKALSEH